MKPKADPTAVALAEQLCAVLDDMALARLSRRNAERVAALLVDYLANAGYELVERTAAP